MSPKFSGFWSSFDELSARNVHDILKLRQDIFMIEQACLFADIDGKDPRAFHYILMDEAADRLVGAIRVFLDEGDEAECRQARIGRVVVSSSYRGLGLGRRLMQDGIARVEDIMGSVAIHLTAQAHLEAFYGSLGFERASDDFLEDGIMHLNMLRPAS
ncbi:MAG: GNAT family N-acetyltransferase [Rhodobacteraceae bacterium]|nr:GNAT family N-acetyltransferase [Paracoccaceae bacterium]